MCTASQIHIALVVHLLFKCMCFGLVLNLRTRHRYVVEAFHHWCCQIRLYSIDFIFDRRYSLVAPRRSIYSLTIRKYMVWCRVEPEEVSPLSFWRPLASRLFDSILQISRSLTACITCSLFRALTIGWLFESTCFEVALNLRARLHWVIEVLNHWDDYTRECDAHLALSQPLRHSSSPSLHLFIDHSKVHGLVLCWAWGSISAWLLKTSIVDAIWFYTMDFTKFDSLYNMLALRSANSSLTIQKYVLWSCFETESTPPLSHWGPLLLRWLYSWVWCTSTAFTAFTAF
jgi:hypothetical protein